MEKKHHSLITITFKARKIILLVAEHTTGTKFGRIGPSYLAQKKNICGKNLCFQPILGAPKRSSSKSPGYTASLTIAAVPIKNGRNPPFQNKKIWTNHFCCEPESFLKVHTIDTIGLSPYLSSQHWQKRWAKSDMFQRAKLQFPPPSADSLSTTVTRKFAKNARILKYHDVMLWILKCCHASKIKRISDSRQHAHIALPKRKTRS